MTPTAQVPRSVVAAGSVALALLAAPLIGLVLRAPWGRLVTLLSSDAATDALRLSAVVSLAATAVVVLLGFPLAWMLARTSFPGHSAARALVLLPMVLPPVVGGTALLFALGRRGFIGRRLDDWFGIVLLGTTPGAIIAASFVALPFFVLTLEAALRQVDIGLEEAADTLGASPGYAMRRVVLPQIRSSLVAGCALAWARALGEFGATITFAGNRAGRTRTLPLEIFVALETDADAAVALSLVLVAVSLAVLVGLRGRWWPR